MEELFSSLDETRLEWLCDASNHYGNNFSVQHHCIVLPVLARDANDQNERMEVGNREGKIAL